MPIKALLAKVSIPKKKKCGPFILTSVQTCNQQLDNGQFVPFVIVPFQDGTMPNQASIKFLSSSPLFSCLKQELRHLTTSSRTSSPLTTAVTIRGLNLAQATSYAQGYGLGHIASLSE